MPSTRAMVEETRRLLFSGHREAKVRLAAAIATTTTTTITVDSVTGLVAGTLLQVDSELLEVYGTPTTAVDGVTVIRGAFGSTPATHADDTFVTVNPRFPDISIVTELNHELLALSGEGLFRILGTTLTYDPSIRGYDLGATTKFVDLYGNPEVETTGTSKYWPQIRNWRLSRGMATGEFASTDALFLHGGGADGQSVRVRYKAGFSPVSTSDLTLDVATQSGLHEEAMDIMSMGAAIRLVSPTEVKRNFTEGQGEPRRATEVPPGARSGSVNGLRLLRQNRIRDERARLHAQYPTRAPRV